MIGGGGAGGPEEGGGGGVYINLDIIAFSIESLGLQERGVREKRIAYIEYFFGLYFWPLCIIHHCYMVGLHAIALILMADTV